MNSSPNYCIKRGWLYIVRCSVRRHTRSTPHRFLRPRIAKSSGKCQGTMAHTAKPCSHSIHWPWCTVVVISIRIRSVSNVNIQQAYASSTRVCLLVYTLDLYRNLVGSIKPNGVQLLGDRSKWCDCLMLISPPLFHLFIIVNFVRLVPVSVRFTVLFLMSVYGFVCHCSSLSI